MAAEARVPRRGVGLFGWIKRMLVLALLGALGAGGWWFYQGRREVQVLRRMVERLTAEQRVAEVWVEEHQCDAQGRPVKVRLKVLEFGTDGKPLEPVFCEFSVNDVIHFEAMVIRLNDELIMEGEGKSVYFFRRAFALDDDGDTYEKCDINKPMEIPGGYRITSGDARVAEIESRYWKSFWRYALDEEQRREAGVKTAQIEAPATRFVPDRIYRLVLEHDGGLYIQASPVPAILKGERVKIEATPRGEAPAP